MKIYNKCRICFTKGQSMTKLSKKISESDVTNLKALEYVMNTKVLECSKYPKIICFACKSSLESAYNLKVRFNDTTKKLKKLYGLDNSSKLLKPIENVSLTETDRLTKLPSVEVIVGPKRYAISDLVIVEQENKEDTGYNGFLKNLGTTISAKFVDKNYKFTNKEEETNILIIQNKNPDNSYKLQNLNLLNNKGTLNENILSENMEKTFDLNSPLGALDEVDLDKFMIKLDPKVTNKNDKKETKLDIDEYMCSVPEDEQNLVKQAMTYTNQCKKCLKYFCKKGSYLNHVRKKNCDSVGAKANETLESQRKMEVTDSTYQCDICGYVGKNRRNYLNHMQKHNGPLHQCDKCDYSTTSRGCFNAHSLKHKESKYNCNFCGKKFTLKGHYKEHLRIHSKNPLFLCALCGKGFNHKTAHEYHLKKHNDERNYACQFCNKRFLVLGTLNVHERIHTGETPYKCKLCKKAFRTKRVLANHENNQHTELRKFKCDFCGKDFISEKYLLQHLRSHSGSHQCNFCSKSFLEVEYLNAHLRKKHTL